jgi:anti-sigma-K factor RskA
MMAAPHSTRHDELLPAYALGALDGGELRELEEHLAAGCAECGRQLAVWQGDLEELASSVPPLAPSAETRRRILRLAGPAAGNAPNTPLPFPAPEVRRPRVPRWLGLAAAALIALVIWGGVRQARLSQEAGRLRADRDRLAQQVAALDRRIAEVQGDNKRLAETLSLITAPGARSVQLAGLGSSPGAAGHTFVNPRERKAIFYAFDLPALAPGKTYQLWWIAAGRPVPAGTFGVDEHGSARILVDKVENVDEIQAWAVTVEPAGGVPQPTGEMVLKG